MRSAGKKSACWWRNRWRRCGDSLAGGAGGGGFAGGVGGAIMGKARFVPSAQGKWFTAGQRQRQFWHLNPIRRAWLRGKSIRRRGMAEKDLRIREENR